jgi:hypothetical protein
MAVGVAMRALKSGWALMVMVCMVIPIAINIVPRLDFPYRAVVLQYVHESTPVVYQYHHMFQRMIFQHPYLAMAGMMTLLLALTRRGRRSMGKMTYGAVRSLSHVLYEATYHNAAQRDGRAYGLWWFGHSVGVLWLLYALWNLWLMGIVYYVAWWIVLWLYNFTFRRYRKWHSLRFRLPGRFRWRGIPQELGDASGLSGRFSRRSGRGRK